MWNHDAALSNIFNECIKSGLGRSNMWVGTTIPDLASGSEEPRGIRQQLSPPDPCSEISGLKPWFWFWGDGCCSLVRLSRAHILFYLSFLLSQGLFLLLTSMRSSKRCYWAFYLYWFLQLAFSIAFVTLTVSSLFYSSIDKKWDLEDTWGRQEPTSK